MTQALAVLEPQQIQPADLVRHTTDIAGLCKEIVVRSAKKIGNRLFVPVEGWMSIATAHGCIVTILSVEKITGGMLAIAELRRAVDGFPMSRAEGFVGDDEETWANRPEYARRAMAQTRAMSRVCRTAFAHVVVMMNAGLETTPMEEVPRDGFNDDHEEGTVTTDPVPGTFWEMKKKDGMKAAIDWLSRSYEGAKVGVRKMDDGWKVVVFSQPEAQEKSQAKSEPQRATGPRTEKSATPSGNWRDVVCTYGKKNGPLRGKTLGELNDDSLKYLAEIFLADGKEIKEGDRKMVAALALWQASGNRKVAAPERTEDEPALKFNGTTHEKLFEQLVWGNIKVDDFMAAMKAAGAIPENASSFMMMSDETAKTFLDDFETAEQHVKTYLAEKGA